MVTVGKVVHGLELFVDNTDTGFVGADGDILDILHGLAHLGEGSVHVLGGLNGSLRVEFG